MIRINNISAHKIIKDKKEEILFSLLKFSLSISIEYKEGNITSMKKEELDNDVVDWLNFNFNNQKYGNTNREKKEEDKTYREKFIEKYYLSESFSFYPSVYNFITGGSIFHYDELVLELEKLYHIHKNEIQIHYEVYNQLSYTQVYSLSDKRYKELTLQMLKFSDAGLYDLTYYLTIFHFSVRFGNPFKFNLDKLEKRIICGMKKGKQSYKFQPLNHYLSVDENSAHKE